MRRYLVLPLMVGLLALAVPVRGVEKEKAGKGDVAEVVKGNNAFAFDLYGRLRTEKGNLFFSPYSISTALAMTYAGARTDTEKEMAKTLHFALSQEKLHPGFHKLMEELNGSGKKQRYELVTANALWGQQGFKFLPAFTKTMKDDYDGGLRRVDFQNATEDSRQAINDWVKKQTKNKIKDLMPKGVLNDRTRLVLTNAIYFKAGWQKTFYKPATQDADFHTGKDTKVTVKMMSQTDTFPFLRGKGFQAVELPYRDDELSMVILLPSKKDGLAAFEKGITSEKVDGWLARLRNERVYVSLPRFKITGEFNLNKTLQGMGMRLAFKPRRADFSGMNGDRRLFVQAVVHKAYVDVNEQGTEAAGATGVAIGDESAPPQFIADHPFVFLIRHRATGSILFLGRLSQPS
jgi:serpin B